MDRRTFVARTAGAAGVAAFGVACTDDQRDPVAGDVVNDGGDLDGWTFVARPDDVLLAAGAGRPLEVPEARAYVVTWDPNQLAEAAAFAADQPVVGGVGLLVLDQQCTHLHCRVPYCAASGWFECPCHGSKFSTVGDWMGGPAPRGLDRRPARVEAGWLLAGPDPIEGLRRQAPARADEPAGPHCMDV